MDVEDIRKKRDEMQCRITKIICEFNKDTGCQIQHLSCDICVTHQVYTSPCVSIFDDIEYPVKLDIKF